MKKQIIQIIQIAIFATIITLTMIVGFGVEGIAMGIITFGIVICLIYLAKEK